jgi:hypothetical protein
LCHSRDGRSGATHWYHRRARSWRYPRTPNVVCPPLIAPPRTGRRAC